jgi:hypothetical protein
VKRLIDSCFLLLVDDITSFGGRVDKILGDGILALFGATVAHEDDAERAVRAALRMRATLNHFVATSGLAGSTEIRMRIGINTGEVLVGTLAGTEYTAMGDVVNTASRLQSAAEPGGILVGHTTYALTSQAIRFEPAGELDARGREQSIKAWLALEATAPPGSRSRRGRTGPLVGRQPELAIGRAALDLVTLSNRSVLLAISGENGVGKSRLAEELVDYMQNTVDAAVLEGACVPYGEANVWYPIANALSRYLDFDPTLPIEEIREIGRARAVQTHSQRRRDRARPNGRRLRAPARLPVGDRQARGTGGARLGQSLRQSNPRTALVRASSRAVDQRSPLGRLRVDRVARTPRDLLGQESLRSHHGDAPR